MSAKTAIFLNHPQVPFADVIYGWSLKHGLLNRWTSHWLFRGAKKYDWGGGAWDPNYDPGADFLDHNFLSSKNSG